MRLDVKKKKKKPKDDYWIHNPCVRNWYIFTPFDFLLEL